jgi:hypothetical protein
MGADLNHARTLERAIEANLTGDSAVICVLYTDDVQGSSPVLNISSAAELAVELEDREDAFSDVEIELAPLEVSGDKACVEWVARATHSGALVVDDDLVIEPTGRRFALRGVTVADFEGDRICAFRQYWDEVELLEGLGLIPTE